jgi:hypothetical protein
MNHQLFGTHRAQISSEKGEFEGDCPSRSLSYHGSIFEKGEFEGLPLKISFPPRIDI